MSATPSVVAPLAILSSPTLTERKRPQVRVDRPARRSRSPARRACSGTLEVAARRRAVSLLDQGQVAVDVGVALGSSRSARRTQPAAIDRFPSRPHVSPVADRDVRRPHLVALVERPERPLLRVVLDLRLGHEERRQRQRLQVRGSEQPLGVGGGGSSNALGQAFRATAARATSSEPAPSASAAGVGASVMVRIRGTSPRASPASAVCPLPRRPGLPTISPMDLRDAVAAPPEPAETGRFADAFARLAPAFEAWHAANAGGPFPPYVPGPEARAPARSRMPASASTRCSMSSPASCSTAAG